MTSSPLPWVKRLLQRPENTFLCEVSESFIQNRFNLLGLEDQVPNFEVALSTVLGEYVSGGKESEAELFYGLVHARYVMTNPGINKMLKKYMAGHFGHCPRVYCNRSPVLPIGLSNTVGCDTVRFYCPRCQDVYALRTNTTEAGIDGAYFGTGFPHMVFMSRPEMKPAPSQERYVPKLFGFRIHNSANNDGVRLFPTVDTCVHYDELSVKRK